MELNKTDENVADIHDNFDMSLSFEDIPEFGIVRIFRGRVIHICLPNMYKQMCPTAGEVKRKIQEVNKISQLPPRSIRLFSGGKELLDDDEQLTYWSHVDVVYGDEQAVHIRDGGNTSTVGVQSSDLVQTLITKRTRFWTVLHVGVYGLHLHLNGHELDPNRSISSYNITEGTVLDGDTFSRMWPFYYRHWPIASTDRSLWGYEETTEEVPPAFMNKLKEAVGRFGDVCGTLTSVLSSGTCRKLADIVGAGKLDDILTFVTRLIKKVKFGLPEVLQRARNKVLSDQDFIGVANSIGESWQSLGYSLGLNQVQIEQISLDNQTTRMRIFSMLKLWAKSNTGDPKAGTLLQTMWNCAGLNVHWGTIFKMFA